VYKGMRLRPRLLPLTIATMWLSLPVGQGNGMKALPLTFGLPRGLPIFDVVRLWLNLCLFYLLVLDLGGKLALCNYPGRSPGRTKFACRG